MSEFKRSLEPRRKIDLFKTEILMLLKNEGELFRRRTEPIISMREPATLERVYTIVNGNIESSNIARPGEDIIITGSRGEEFVFTNKKFLDMYIEDNDGNIVPRERLVLAVQNPYGVPIRIEAPWSTPKNIQTQDGTEDAMLVFALDSDGQLNDDRYIIGDKSMLLANYEPIQKSDLII